MTSKISRPATIQRPAPNGGASLAGSSSQPPAAQQATTKDHPQTVGQNSRLETIPSAIPTHGPSLAGQNPRRAVQKPTPENHAPGGLNSRPATVTDATPKGSPSLAGADTPAPGQPAVVRPTPKQATLTDPVLVLAADVLDDIERVRIANENRLRQLTRGVADKDGIERGFGLDPRHPDVARLAVMVETLAKVEHDAELNLGRQMRRHPLYPWIKAQRGVGDKQAARLLAAIGDPYINSATGEPRTVSALWAYSGLHVINPDLPASDQTPCDTHLPSVAGRATKLPTGSEDQPMPEALAGPVGVAPKRQRGMRANWSPMAKMRAHLIAASCIRQIDATCRVDVDDAQTVKHADGCGCSPYRIAYDVRRAHTAVTRPEWTDGHSHNDGLRIASKALLRDLWREARRLHESP